MSIKAFDLVPAIERVHLMSEKAKTQIECIDVCGKNLYIGTNDCFVVHYIIEERSSNSGKTSFHSDKQGHKYLTLKKPVVQLKAASALNRILVLCDFTLTMLNMLDLEPAVGGAKVKGVTHFCLNNNPVQSSPFSVEVCVALKKKQLQLYNITDDRMIHVKDISLSEPASVIGLDGHVVCAAMMSQYCMINYETGQNTDLFPVDTEHTHPIVKRISKEEFLLTGPSALGMFVTSEGISQRPPLQWSENLRSVGYVHPYIIAMNDEFITIHSILDQQQKQAIPFQGGVVLNDFDGRLFIASPRAIYSMVPVAWEKQVQGLLADKRTQEALDLARNANHAGLTKDKFLKIFRRIQQQAAFIEFSQKNFDEAQDLFKGGQVDIRELISLYPRLMPSSSNYQRSMPALHEIADINQLARGDQNVISQYKTFLITYLEDIRGTKDSHGLKQEIDVALLKLYAERNSAELLPLVEEDSGCDLKDCVEWLEKYQRHHALGLLYKYHGDNDKALNIWTRLVNGDIQDELFPGFEFVVNFLSSLSDHDLVWKYIDWALERDQESSIKILTERPAQEPPSERLRPESVIDYLHRYPKAVVTYLEYLVFQRKLEKEKYHTHLAVLYLDNVLQLMKNNSVKKEQIDIARSKLRHMLQMSSLYRVQLILGKAKEQDMHAECAILYGKLEDHEKALKILVHKLRDYGAAENYCLVNSEGRDTAYRKRLFHILLSVYLDPANEKKDLMVGPAINLLNSNVGDFDVAKVIQIIPDSWSIALLSDFLKKAVRTNMHTHRMTRVERMMSRGENLLVKEISIEGQHQPIVMTEEKPCAVCNRPFNEPSFVRYPNGIITHIHCAKNKHVCPVTGKLFCTKKS
ncbi:transforming growth factor-beta receptor-associated protein 1-like [Ruditapes philippinarum]|uniref:transforming growth factor-beta receptor-associated protein 1-like n=1 Tax=Ruditapes philippinarum TaxID=129788 RepID=UPI00295A7F65|nr:transforming growth factor-beta receptor-associated protein 1-like [Ruditapes philippinarum]